MKHLYLLSLTVLSALALAEGEPREALAINRHPARIVSITSIREVSRNLDQNALVRCELNIEIEGSYVGASQHENLAAVLEPVESDTFRSVEQLRLYTYNRPGTPLVASAVPVPVAGGNPDQGTPFRVRVQVKPLDWGRGNIFTYRGEQLGRQWVIRAVVARLNQVPLPVDTSVTLLHNMDRKEWRVRLPELEQRRN